MASQAANNVFLSFRGEDTRHSFTDHLYDALKRAGISAFRDNEEIKRGEELQPEIERIITESRASVIVFSLNYATSTWCLDELVLILEQRRECNHFVLPVFYHVDPCDVRKQINTFAIEVKASSRWTDENVKLWKKALSEVADLAGMELLGSEADFLKDIVDTVYDELVSKEVKLPLNITGMAARYGEISSWLNQPNVQFLAICGMGGSGKTTLAKYIYNSNWKTYENMSFLEGISGECEASGSLRKLQKQLLEGILGGKKIKIPSVSEGTCKIEEALQTKRSLIVLDDISEHSQLVALLGTGKIHAETKIIITTTWENKDHLFKHTKWMCQEYEMKLLNNNESLELLSWHAFGSKVPMEGFEDVADQVVRYCEGNPLAIEVLASSLSNSNVISLWESQLRLLENDIHSGIQKVLITSYDSLSFDTDKELFLHIACFFVGIDMDYVVKILEHDYCALSGIKSLSNRCLISVSPNKKLMMHRLIQEMGKTIVRQESTILAERSRVWLSSDSHRILSQGKGSKTIEGLALDMQMLGKQKSAFKSTNLKTDALQKMDRLKLLQLKFVQLTGSYENISEDLRWLCWPGSHLRSIPSDLFMGNLVALDMSYSNLDVFEPPMVLQSLQILNLTGSQNLSEIRNMFRIPRLETLILWNCHSLTLVCKTIGDLTKLTLLNMTGCKKLCKSELTEASTSGGGVAQRPTFLLPPSLHRLFLKDCNLHSTDHFFSFSVQPSLQYVNLGNNLFEFLPFHDHLKNLRVLDLSFCSRLKQLLDLPSTLAELYIYYCTSLEKISFQSHRFTLQEFGYEGCISLTEIEGFIKLVHVVKLGENDLGHMKWLKKYQNYEVCLVGDDELTKGRSPCLQMLYEFNIMSTSLPGIWDRNEIPEYVSELSSLSFEVPSCPKNRRLKGLEVTFKYTAVLGDDDWVWFCKICTTNGVDLMYNPKVFGKPESGEVGIWLSYWPIGNTLHTGDTVNVSIAVISGLEVLTCGVSLVYTDDDEETLKDNTIMVEVLGGDLSGFQLSTRAYYLCRRDFYELMEVGRLTRPDWFSILVGDSIECTEVRGWRKTGRPLQLNPSFTELKFVRCIIHGPQSEEIYKIAEMSKSYLEDRTLDPLLSESISKLSESVTHVAQTTTNFTPELQLLSKTLQRITRLYKIVNMNRELDRTETECKVFSNEILEAKKLVDKCSKVQRNIIEKFNYSLKLKDVNDKLLRFFHIEAQASQSRGIRETLLGMNDFKSKMESLSSDLRNRTEQPRFEAMEREKFGWRVPTLPNGIVAFDEPLAKLKAEVVTGMDSDDQAVLVVAAAGGCGKTTLVKMLCHDHEILEIFGENIFFVTVSETPNFMVIVNDLLDQNFSDLQVYIESNEDAKNKLENFLNEKVSGPMLLVLDDVWSDSFIKNFPSMKRGCKILVTSRTAFPGYNTFRFDPLNEKDAKTLFCRSAFDEGERGSSPIIDENLVDQMVTCCKRHPLTLAVVGRSLNGKGESIWRSMLNSLSKGRPVLDLHEDVLTRLERSFEAFDEEFKQCFLDFALFREGKRIPVSALLDMWVHLYNHDGDGVDTLAMIFQLSYRNLVDLMTTGNDYGARVNYCDQHFVTQHDLLRELVIHLNSKLPLSQRSRLILDEGEEAFSASFELVQEAMHARILSIFTGESFFSRWWDMKFPNLEVLILNFMSETYELPHFLARMQKLKILNITNHGLRRHTYFGNFDVFGSSHNLTTIRFENVMIDRSILELKKLQKVSFIMCEFLDSFEKRVTNPPFIWTQLVEIEIYDCHRLFDFPGALFNSVYLKKISITNCDTIHEISEDIGELTNLETLSLRSCTSLIHLPYSMCKLKKLRHLDISDCLRLSRLPYDMGDMSGLRTIYMKGCTKVRKLPESVKELSNVYVVCDKEIAHQWRKYSNVEVDLVEEDRLETFMKII